jgi:hypothetical protein
MVYLIPLLLANAIELIMMFSGQSVQIVFKYEVSAQTEVVSCKGVCCVMSLIVKRCERELTLEAALQANSVGHISLL